MPRDGSGVYSKPANTTPSANDLIESAKFNTLMDDIASDLNTDRPVVAGGTGASTEIGAMDSLFAKSSNIASAATTNLANATGTYVTITGTTTITGFGTVDAGAIRILQFSGAVTITHNATSLILPAGASITTSTGDIGIFVSEGSGNWRCIGGTIAVEVSKDPSPQLGGDLDANGNQIKWAKGADVASAAALPVLTDGNYFDVTGTTTITSINSCGGDGTIAPVIKLHFDAALTLTHHATNLILPGGANITTAAGDEAEFVEYASGDWRCTNYTKADGSSFSRVVQIVNTETGEVATGTTTIPADNTIPQNTEGTEFMTLVITPTDSNSILEITVVVNGSHSTTGQISAALFQDSTANALAMGMGRSAAATGYHNVVFKHRMTAGTTSATTLKVRAGNSNSGTYTFNGTSGSRIGGGVVASSITIKEIAA